MISLYHGPARRQFDYDTVCWSADFPARRVKFIRQNWSKPMMKRNLRSIFLAIVATAVVASFAFRTAGTASAEATANDVFAAVLKLTSQIPGEAGTS